MRAINAIGWLFAFCTRMRAIFSRDVDTTRAIHHRNDRKLLYILLTDVKVADEAALSSQELPRVAS